MKETEGEKSIAEEALDSVPSSVTSRKDHVEIISNQAPTSELHSKQTSLQNRNWAFDSKKDTESSILTK